MKLTIILVNLLLFIGITISFAQKKPLDIEAYKLWRYVEEHQMSYDGKWITYRYKYTDTTGHKNEIPISYLYNTTTGKTYEFRHVKQLQFWDNGKRIKYTVTHPSKAGVEKPRDSVFFMSLKNMKKTYWNHPYTCNVSPRNSMVSSFYTLYKTKNGKEIKRLVLTNFTTMDSTVIDSISSYKFVNNYESIIYIKEKNGRAALFGGPVKGVQHVIYNNPEGYLVKFSIDEEQKGVFNVATDSSYLKKPDLLYRFSLADSKYHLLMDTKKIELENRFRVKGGLYTPFNRERYIYVDIDAPATSKQKKKINPNKSFDLELWTWNEEYAQNRRREVIRNPSLPKYVFHTDSQSCIQIAPEGMDQIKKPDCDEYEYILVGDQRPYRQSAEWISEIATDWYLVNLQTGKRTPICQNLRDSPEWSPDGKYALFYFAEEKNWFKLNPKTGELTNISSAIGYPVYNEWNDEPQPAVPNKIAGWTADGKQVVLSDRYDLWVVDLTGEKAPYSLTNGWGRKNEVSLRLLNSFNSSKKINLQKEIILKASRTKNLNQGIYLRQTDGKIKKITEGAYCLNVLQVAENGKYCIFTRESYTDPREIWWSKNDFKHPVKVTNSNPQQKDYNWGSVQLVEWTNFDGQPNRGLLYLPENYNPSKRYPVIVNFYETLTYKYHLYPTPSQTKAMINVVSYVSNGYVVFMPNIRFTVGSPGESCYNAVVSGTQMLIDRGIADKEKIGVQGHSWSGYQVAYLITRTDIFACANAAAPVSSMVSAYTGIRENSGMPRMFMYETGQSRIGKNLWEAPELYIKNSPIFNADKINTPLLILHCDKDGAVPYSEGLNLFLAMRRLQKPAWLLNYEGEGHVLQKRPAAIDFTIRLKQFFDYYLKNTPMPRWMKEGINIYEKGIDQKYDYAE